MLACASQPYAKAQVHRLPLQWCHLILIEVLQLRFEDYRIACTNFARAETGRLPEFRRAAGPVFSVAECRNLPPLPEEIL